MCKCLERLPSCSPTQLGRHHGAARLSRVASTCLRARLHPPYQAYLVWSELYVYLSSRYQRTWSCPKPSSIYGLLTHISEIKNMLGIDTGIVPNIVGFNMQKHDDYHKLWARALAIYGSSAFALSL